MIRYRIMLFFLVAFGLTVLGTGYGKAQAAEVPRMSTKELKAQLGNPDIIIMDVRTEGDWKSSQSKITGAVRENPSTVESWVGKYPKNKTLVLYCA